MTRTILVTVLGLVAGCLTPEDDIVDFSEDFERCGTCDWQVAGDVSVVTTVHPGEHAVRLGEGAGLEHALGIGRTVGDAQDAWSGNFTDGNWIEYTTDCTGTPRLALDPDGVVEVAVRVRLEGPAGDGFLRRRLMFPPLPIWAGEDETITFTRLLVETGAPCRLDNVRVMVSGGTLAY